ncbi:MAG: hypothetical protein IPO21_05315 [Bacteroidales bacterium]|nr:hypothetical protein [Bacteroidales bacterium]
MSLRNGKKLAITEIEGIRNIIIEENVTLERADFLKSLLLFNKVPVSVVKSQTTEENPTVSYSVLVSDLSFNPLIAVFEKRLYNKYGKVVTPAFWEQIYDADNDVPYWSVNRPVKDIYKAAI